MVIENCKELHLNTCILLRITKHPSRKVLNFRHLLSCDTIGPKKLWLYRNDSDICHFWYFQVLLGKLNA